MGNQISAPAVNNVMMPCEVFNLHIAVMQNDARAVKQLANLGVNLNHPWNNVKYPSVKDGTTALCEAVSLNHKPVVKVLLEEDTDINQCDSFGYTPLHKAAYHTRLELVSLLIKKGANVNALDRDGNTPLHTCCKVGVIQSPSSICHIATLLLEAHASLSKRNKAGQTPLHIAAEWGLPHLIKQLLKAGSDIDATDNCYRTPLHCCLETLLTAKSLHALNLAGFVMAISILLQQGCDPLNMAEHFLAPKGSHQSTCGVGLNKRPPDQGFEKGRCCATRSSLPPSTSGPKMVAIGSLLLNDPDVWNWITRGALPPSLKHLCRVYVRSRLNMTQDRLIKTVSRFVIPTSLKDYLLRTPI